MLFFRPFIYMEEVSFMATQIASTPVVRGKEAVKIYKEANQKRKDASKTGAEVLKKKFNGRLK